MSTPMFNCFQRVLRTVGRNALIGRTVLVRQLPRQCPASVEVGRRYLNVSNSSGYDGDGKTTVHIANKDEVDLLILDTYSNTGFRLNNGIFLVGPVALFPRSVFQWDVNSVADINEESLSLFWLLEPKIDILIVGVGDQGLQVDPKVRLFMARKGINMECLPTAQALPLFNFMNMDRRNVAAALIPPGTVDLNDRAQDYMDLHQTRNTIYKDLRLIERNLHKHLEEDRKVTQYKEEKVREAEKEEENNPRKHEEPQMRKW